MSQSEDEKELVQSLRNELNIVRSELVSLQSARSVRMATFLRQISKSKPSEWPRLVKSIPLLLKKGQPVSRATSHESSNYDDPDYHSSVSKTQPLYQFPNISIATVGSDIKKYFSQSCNVVELGDPLYKNLLSYQAIQVVAISEHEYSSAAHLSLIKESVGAGAKLIIFSSGSNPSSNIDDLATYEPLIRTLDESLPASVRPYIDIYSLEAHLPDIEGLSGVIDNSKGEDIEDDYSKLLVLDSDNNPLKPSEALRRIGTGQPVVFWKNKPSWLPEDLKVFSSRKDLSSFIKESKSIPYFIERYSAACRRSVILNNNSAKSVYDLLSDAGIDCHEPLNPSISIILATRRPQHLERSIRQIEDQSMQPKQVLLLLHGLPDNEIESAIKLVDNSKLNIKISTHSEKVLFGEVLNAGLSTSHGEFTTKMDDDDYYGPNHLADLYAAYLHSRADIVGKWNNWVYIAAEDKVISWVPEMAYAYSQHIPGGTLFAKTQTLRNLRFGYVKRAIDSELYRRAVPRGALLYSTHRYNYVRVRDQDHTYKTSDADFKSRAHRLSLDGLDLENILYC